MIKVHHRAMNRTIQVDRIINHLEGSQPGPTVVFFAGMHGNESSGVFALHDIMFALKKQLVPIKGNIFALSGNLPALAKGKRYCTEDLNRLWDKEQIELLNNGALHHEHVERREQQDIYQTLQQIVTKQNGPFYFMDLHTTSSESIPFVVVNDSLLNRKFAKNFPVPMILGIEEYLDGPILSYINELGYVAFGFEAGQHDDLASYENQMAFIYLCLVHTESVEKSQVNYYHYQEQLAKTSINAQDIYEIKYRFKLNEKDQFKMLPGFVNFQKVKKGQEMAIRNGEKIIASHTGRVFLPLYQQQGKEGFFEIRSIHPFFLRLSAVLRKTKFAHILPFLPGIQWQSENHEALVVNLKIARFLTKPFLHLLGYRSKKIDKTHLVIKNREAASRNEEYTTEWNI
jgi:succinylglutamate desuccinylase